MSREGGWGLVEKMDISDQNSYLAFVVPIYKRLFAHLWEVYQGQSGWLVTEVLAHWRAV